ncbi:MAG: hypothetical protein V4638_00685 [Bacteroidota bacterium]
MGAFENLIDQIDAFIRKFYKNQMIKGLILFSAFFLVSFLLTITLEYFGRFGHGMRAFLFYGFVAINLGILGYYFLIPVLKLFSFGKRIDRYQASDVIGKFFPNISDRLKNTLQLNDSLSANNGNLELLRASVQQRSGQLSLVPFSSAIQLKENKRYLKYLIPVLLLFLALGIFVPAFLKQATERVVYYDQKFDFASFKFNLSSQDLKVEEGNDLPVSLSLSGTSLPDKVYLVSENGKFLMEKTSKNEFKGIINKPKKSGSFYFVANDYSSEPYNFVVFGKAVVGKFQASLVYPSYLGKANEVISNAGDMTIPEGTIIEWSVFTKNTNKSIFVVNKEKRTFDTDGFSITKKFVADSDVKLFLTNANSDKQDSLSFNIHVVKDAYPQIIVNEVKDSVSDGLRFFSGSIADDYGFRSLNFAYTIISEDGKKRSNSLSVRAVSGTQLPFDFAVDFRREELKLNDRIEYYFVVSDNDGVNGSKSTRSNTFTYQLPSLEELNDKRDEENEQAKNDLQSLLQKSQEFQKNVDRLKKDMLNSKSTDWNKKNQLNQLKEEQKSLQQSLEQMQQMLEKSAEEKNQLSEIDQEIMEKQQLMEELLKEVMDEELMKLLEELEKLMNENNKELQQDKMDELKMSSEDMKKQLDRSLEMLKKMQVNEKIDDVEKELKQLAEDQKKLQAETENKSLSKEEAEKKQDDLNKKFEELKEDLKELEQKNSELDKPMELPNTDELKEEISNEMKEAKDQLQKSNSGKAGQKQKEAAEDMEKLANQLDEAQKESNQQQQEEDINSLREVLESLVSLSFDQESLMQRFVKVNDADPAYKKYSRLQKRIIDDTKIVADSLNSLAKRQPTIAKFIDKELNDIAMNHTKTVSGIQERRKNEIASGQQFVMSSYNNLALLLNESLEQMQQQMKGEKEGSGQCNNPGGKGKPKPGAGMSSGDMKEMIKKQLEQMEKGPSPGGKKPGDKPGDQPGMQPGGKEGQGGMGLGNKEVAKMAAEQSAIRQRLEQLRNELNKDGKGSGNQLNPLIKELEQQEKDLVNKKFDNTLINRQKNILTRLLESEKAMMMRGFEEQRESKSGKSDQFSNQIQFTEYNRLKLRQIELLRTVDPALNKYYRDRANQYFNVKN